MAWNTWTEGNVLHAASLNENMSLITAVLHSITGGQMAANAINAGTIIADDVIDETHMNYAATQNAFRCLQIGKESGTHQQIMLNGTCVADTGAYTISEVAFVYSDANLAVGDPAFIGLPHVFPTAITDDPLYICKMKSIGTQSCVILAGPGTGNVVATQAIYVLLMGDI